MNKLFKYILENCIDGSEKVDSSTELYKVLTKTLPNKIGYTLGKSDLIVKGSMGQSNKTQYPWIAIMDKNITQSTQYGLYMVYLFKKDMTGFYLSLNQGITSLKKSMVKIDTLTQHLLQIILEHKSVKHLFLKMKLI